VKIIITEFQYRLLIETNINFHLSRGGDGFEDLDNIKPYGSDTIIMMKGRGTGHFGSGLYFSTYNCSFRDKETSLDVYRGDNYPQKFTKVNGGVYRVDFDIYKNLYRVTNNQHAELLFKTLKFTNNIFYKNINYYDGKFDMQNDLSSDYLKLKHNLYKLGLKLPNYRDFIRMIITAGKNIKDKENFASFSTRIMEYNGFNGVNVSGIPEYDNTLHGSVIYDMSKLSDKPIPINTDIFCAKYDWRNDVIDNVFDDDVKLLKGETPMNIEKVSRDKLVMFLKRYKGFLKPYLLNDMGEELKKIHYKTLRKNLINGDINNEPDYKILEVLIDDNRFDIIMDIRCKIADRTILEIILDNLWRYTDENVEKIKNNINRELTPQEKEALKYNL